MPKDTLFLSRVELESGINILASQASYLRECLRKLSVFGHPATPHHPCSDRPHFCNCGLCSP